MGARLEHVSVIDAPVEQVWAALTDLSGWSEWNPTLAYEEGELRVGEVVRMKLNLGKRKAPMRQKIVEVSPPNILRWQSRFGPEWMFVVLRTFRLSEESEGRTRLEQSEEGSGLLAKPIFVFTGPPTVKGYEGIAAGLNRHLGH